MRRRLNEGLRRIPGWAGWLGGAVPLSLLILDTLGGRLGVDPVAAIEHRLGRTAIYFLIASLAVTPLLRLARINLMAFRRTLGLLAFAYGVLHLAAWIGFDMGLLWSQAVRDIVKRPYLIFGMASLLLMLPLAITSNGASIRRMGARAWKGLHRLVYPAAILAGLHWLWVGKVWHAKPVLIAVLILALLATRLLPRGQMAGWGRRKMDDKSTT